MIDDILHENQKKRITVPIWLLLCYSLFTVWQMGVVFFSGEALSLHGKTPLPISEDNLTALIAAAYILSIIYLVFFQKHSVMTAKTGVSVSLAASLALYLPLPDVILAILIGIQTFCCVFLIGVCIAVIVNLFTEKTELFDILITAVFADVLIALLQNDFISVPYAVFHAFTVIALLLVLLFFCRLPKTDWPVYTDKKDQLVKPRRFFAGIYFMIGISCILTLFGNTVSESITHGVSIFYISTAVSGAVLFLLWKIFGVSPLRCGKILIALGALGFLLAIAGSLYPAMLYISCLLLGCGNLACCLSSFYGIVLMKSYPSKYITPVIILMAVLTVLLHSALLEAFRDSLTVLYIIYAVLALTAALVYLVIEPYLLWSAKQPENDLTDTAQTTKSEEKEREEEKEQKHTAIKDLSFCELDTLLSSKASAQLSGQELRVAELILSGYAGKEIAEILSITENTVKGYRKNLYAKLGIHSIRELFVLTDDRRDK